MEHNHSVGAAILHVSCPKYGFGADATAAETFTHCIQARWSKAHLRDFEALLTSGFSVTLGAATSGAVS